jgi:hypothetical protein
MADIFLSYARATQERVAGLGAGLEAGGYRLWWDRALNASEDYAMVIEAELDAAACVVVAWSQPARHSLWVRAEANEALDAGKLVQINLDEARLPLPFRALQCLDFRRWGGERQGSPWQEFERRVAGTVRGERRLYVGEDGGPLGPALQGFGPAAMVGWAAILLAAALALATGMVAIGRLAPATFSALALLGLGLAAILLALAAFALARAGLASRR